MPRGFRPARAGFWVRLGMCWLSLALLAQADSAEPAQAANRYLLIFDTSRGMKSREPATIEAVHNLLISGFQGQLQPGDTLGIWTFNEEVSTGQMPLQRWSTDAEPGITSSVLSFLRRQTYDKQAAFDKLSPLLDRLIKDSPALTILLISDGSSPLHGIPFEDRVNRLYEMWRKQQQRTRQPFVTVWRAEGGRVPSE